MPNYKPLPGVYIDCILEANETATDYEDDDSDTQDDTEELCPTCSGTGRLSDTTHRPQFDPTQNLPLRDPKARPKAELRSARSRRKEAQVQAVAGLMRTAAAVHDARGNISKAAELREHSRRILAGESPLPFTPRWKDMELGR